MGIPGNPGLPWPRLTTHTKSPSQIQRIGTAVGSNAAPTSPCGPSRSSGPSPRASVGAADPSSSHEVQGNHHGLVLATLELVEAPDGPSEALTAGGRDFSFPSLTTDNDRA
jgi:hypothetical protein